jgi:predicted Na+-dependent transporter
MRNDLSGSRRWWIVAIVATVLFGVIAVAVAMLIHGRKPLTPWLLVGLIPSAVGIGLIYR